MIRYLWPHFMFVVVTAGLVSRVRKTWQMFAIGIAAAVLTALLYAVLDNGVAPPHSQGIIAGQYAALFVAATIPMLATAAVVSLANQRKAPRALGLTIAAAIGIVLTLGMPGLQAGLGCMLTGICP